MRGFRLCEIADLPDNPHYRKLSTWEVAAGEKPQSMPTACTSPIAVYHRKHAPIDLASSTRAKNGRREIEAPASIGTVTTGDFAPKSGPCFSPGAARRANALGRTAPWVGLPSGLRRFLARCFCVLLDEFFGLGLFFGVWFFPMAGSHFFRDRFCSLLEGG